MTHTHQPLLLGLLDGRPLPRTELDARLAALRTGPRSSALPAPGTQQDRQLTRWVAQVVLTEELCAAEAAERGLDVTAAPPVRLDQRAAVELGSIAAAAFEGSAAVRAVYAAVTADVRAPGTEPDLPDPTLAREIWQLSTPDGDFSADPDTLPTELAAALRAAGPHHPVTTGSWTATLLERTPTGPSRTTPAAAELLDCARRIAFVRWLDATRADRVTLVPGLEHPGDPDQPDYDHRH